MPYCINKIQSKPSNAFTEPIYLCRTQKSFLWPLHKPWKLIKRSPHINTRESSHFFQHTLTEIILNIITHVNTQWNFMWWSVDTSSRLQQAILLEPFPFTSKVRKSLFEVVSKTTARSIKYLNSRMLRTKLRYLHKAAWTFIQC